MFTLVSQSADVSELHKEKKNQMRQSSGRVLVGTWSFRRFIPCLFHSTGFSQLRCNTAGHSLIWLVWRCWLILYHSAVMMFTSRFFLNQLIQQSQHFQLIRDPWDISTSDVFFPPFLLPRFFALHLIKTCNIHSKHSGIHIIVCSHSVRLTLWFISIYPSADQGLDIYKRGTSSCHILSHTGLFAMS